MPLSINSNNISISQPSVGMNRYSLYSETYKIYLGASAVYPNLRTLLNTNDSNGYKYGDANNSGSIDLTDVLNALKWYLGSGFTSSYTQAVKDRYDAIAVIMEANKATYQADGSWYPDTLIFSTDYRMPHIVSVVHGNFTTADASISYSGGIRVNSQTNIYCATSSNYVAANSFVWGYIKPIVNRNRTEVATGNPIFVSGTLCARLYIQDKGYRGSLLLTPKAFDGYIGFMQEHTYNFSGSVPPVDLHANVTNTIANPGVEFAYTLYYGRYI